MPHCAKPAARGTDQRQNYLAVIALKAVPSDLRVFRRVTSGGEPLGRRGQRVRLFGSGHVVARILSLTFTNRRR